MNANPMFHQTTQQQLNELEIVKLAQSDPLKFEPLYKKYYAQIYRYVFHRVEDEAVALDVTSQVFLKALNNISKYEYRGVPFSSWLFRIAKSEVYQVYRDEKSSRVVDIEVSNINFLIDEKDDDFIKEEKLAKIIEVLKTLKENELTLIEMRFFEKRSFKEIAEILYITENNAKVKCFRVIEKMKKLI
jgi:RNA polymerase sigma-70 factor (ECF subfamily)